VVKLLGRDFSDPDQNIIMVSVKINIDSRLQLPLLVEYQYSYQGSTVVLY